MKFNALFAIIGIVGIILINVSAAYAAMKSPDALYIFIIGSTLLFNSFFAFAKSSGKGMIN